MKISEQKVREIIREAISDIVSEIDLADADDQLNEIQGVKSDTRIFADYSDIYDAVVVLAVEGRNDCKVQLDKAGAQQLIKDIQTAIKKL